MVARTYLLAGAATVALTAGSLAAVAATGVSVHSDGHGMDRLAVTSCAAPASLPGERVTVMLSDMRGRGRMMGGRRMMLRALPGTVAPGEVSLVAANRGTRTHELVVLPLADGAAVGSRLVASDNTVSEAGSLGEASNSCGSGAGHGIRAGRTGWVTLTLRPGRYELLCNLPGHYAAGMYAELDVG